MGYPKLESHIIHLDIVTVSSNTDTTNENYDGTKYMAQEKAPSLLQWNDFKNSTQSNQEAEEVASRDECCLLAQKEKTYEEIPEADNYGLPISGLMPVTKVPLKKHRVLEYEHRKSKTEHDVKQLPISTDINRGSLPLKGSISFTHPIRFITYVFMILLSSYLSNAMNIQPPTDNDQSLSKIQTFVSLSTPYCNPSNLNMTCPFQGSDNMQLLIDRCEFKKMCSSGYTPLCVNNEKGMAFICAPVHLRCEKGHWWRVWNDGEDLSNVKIIVQKCPTGYFQETHSNCINACKSKHLDFTNIEDKYLIYSEGNHIYPTYVYCNYREGHYNRAGRLLLDYDRESEHEPYFCSGNAAVNSPCVEGQEPLPNATCVLPCNPHECRDDHDSFICKQTCRDQIEIGHSIKVIDKPDLDTECDGDSWVCQNGICKQSFNKYVCQCNPGFVKDRKTEKCIGSDVGLHYAYIIGLAFISLVIILLVGAFILYRCNIWRPRCLTGTHSNDQETSSDETGESSSRTSSNDSPSVTRNKSSRNDQHITFDRTETVNITNNTYNYKDRIPEIQSTFQNDQIFKNQRDDRVPFVEATNEDERKPLLPDSSTVTFKEDNHFTGFKKDMDDTNSQAFVSLLNGLMMKCGAVMFKDKVQGTAFRVGPSHVLSAFHVIKDIATDLRGTYDFSQIEKNITLNFNASACRDHTRKIQVKYVFHDDQYDFAILEIKDVHLHTDLPKEFLLWKHDISRENKLKVTVIGYGHEEHPYEKCSETCNIINEDFQQRYQEALASLAQNEQRYKEDLRLQNEDESLVDRGYHGIEKDEYIKLDSFMSKGLSGGPVVTTDEKSPKVIAMVSGGMPNFYFKMSRNKQSSFSKRYLFEICIKTAKIYEVLMAKNPILASQIFPKE